MLSNSDSLTASFASSSSLISAGTTTAVIYEGIYRPRYTIGKISQRSLPNRCLHSTYCVHYEKRLGPNFFHFSKFHVIPIWNWPRKPEVNKYLQETITILAIMWKNLFVHQQHSSHPVASPRSLGKSLNPTFLFFDSYHLYRTDEKIWELVSPCQFIPIPLNTKISSKMHQSTPFRKTLFCI